MVEVGTAAMFALGQAASAWEWELQRRGDLLGLSVILGVVRAAVSAIMGDVFVGIRTAPWVTC